MLASLVLKRIGVPQRWQRYVSLFLATQCRFEHDGDGHIALLGRPPSSPHWRSRWKRANGNITNARGIPIKQPILLPPILKTLKLNIQHCQRQFRLKGSAHCAYSGRRRCRLPPGRDLGRMHRPAQCPGRESADQSPSRPPHPCAVMTANTRPQPCFVECPKHRGTADQDLGWALSSSATTLSVKRQPARVCKH